MSGFDPRSLAPDARGGMMQAGATRLHYVEAGSGPPVMLVGGWPQSVHCWHKVFAPLAARYRVIAVDPPGLGDSEKPAPAYDMESIARTLWAFADAMGLERLDFVGFDIGMWIGYPFARQAPERVRTLTLIDARIPGLVPFPPFNPSAASISWHFAFNMLPGLPELLIEGREREFLKWLFETRTPTPSVFSDADFDEYARVYRGRAAIASAVGYYRALPQTLRQIETLAKGEKLAMPVLAIAGSAGVGAAMIDPVQRIAADARGVVIENCGHYVPEEAPDRLLAELFTFIG